MEVRFLPPSLRRLDEATLDTLALPLFSDERPLRGLPGEVDWRLCGQLSAWILRGVVTGETGERVLLPAGRRLTADRLFLFGAGPRRALGSSEGLALDRWVDGAISTLAAARAGTAALAVPLGGTDPAQAMRLLLDSARAHPEQEELVLLVDPDAQRAMAPVVESERRRERALASR